jgi:hypothetical protein
MVVHDVEIGIALILFQFCIIPTYDAKELIALHPPLTNNNDPASALHPPHLISL